MSHPGCRGYPCDGLQIVSTSVADHIRSTVCSRYRSSYQVISSFIIRIRRSTQNPTCLVYQVGSPGLMAAELAGRRPGFQPAPDGIPSRPRRARERPYLVFVNVAVAHVDGFDVRFSDSDCWKRKRSGFHSCLCRSVGRLRLPHDLSCNPSYPAQAWARISRIDG